MSETTPSASSRATPEAAQTGWSFQLATAAGIPIRVHFTFVLLLVFFGFVNWRQGRRPLDAVFFLILLFACVALHELGHALMARRFGVRTKEIVLYPFGGVASLERMPEGRAELFIALAGPAVNLALAAALVVVILLAGGVPAGVAQPHAPIVTGGILFRLLEANILLAVFNLIPAFPMDGGRVLRSLLTARMRPERATKIAAAVGQGVAVLFGAIGLFAGNFVLLFIALFVFMGAGQEVAYTRQRAAVAGRRAREAMITRFETLATQDSLEHASELLLATHQQDFPVVDAWKRVAGLLHRSALLEGLAKQGKSAAVLDLMERETSVVGPDADLEEVLRLLQTRSAPVLVLDGGALVGIITLENLVEFIEIARRT